MNDLRVWEVSSETSNDPRFCALCQARWGLLVSIPLCAVLLVGGLSILFGVAFNWHTSLLFSASYTAGTLLGDALFWRHPRAVKWVLGWFLLLIGSLYVVSLLTRFIPFLEPFDVLTLPNTISSASSFQTVAGGVVLGAAMGVSGGVVFGAVLGAGLGATMGVSGGLSGSVEGAVVFGAVGGVVLGVVLGAEGGVVVGAVGGVVFGAAMGVLVGVVGGAVFGVAGGAVFGVVLGAAFIIAFLRLPLYLLWELPWCRQLSDRAIRKPAQATWLWHKQPLHYDEIILLPLIGLAEHLAAMAQTDPEACLEALADVGASLRQQWAIPRALSLILYQELRRCTTPALIERFTEATAWLPADLVADDERPLLVELRSISADTAGALAGMIRETRIQGLQTQIKRLQKQRLKLGRSDRAKVRGYAETLVQWQRVLEAEVARLGQERTLIGELPMRYSAGAVLEPGAASFQGRDDLFRALEGLLINAPSKITPLLLGQPRTGKSSAIKQLPLRLGAQVLPVYLDMERRSTAADASGLISDLVGEIRAAALRHPQPISLPSLDDALIRSDPYRVFENWLDEVEQTIGAQRWLLLTLDEFDRIDHAVQSGRIDERIFSMLRSLIQHHPRVALALCGTFTLAECDPRWYEALKSAQTLPVSYLRPEEARQVFTRPAADFPDNVYSEAAIARVLDLTGGQPYLLHLLGATVINAYNRKRADLPPGAPPGTPLPVQAIDDAIPDVLKSGDTALVSIWQWLLKIARLPEVVEALLNPLAHGQSCDGVGDPEQRTELLELFCERELLEQDGDGSYGFRVPLIAHWIRAQRRLPRL